MMKKQPGRPCYLLELTCPLDSVEHLKSSRDQKQGNREYTQLQSEIDCQGVPCF